MRAAVRGVNGAVVYSWQPEAVRQRVRAGQVQHAPIPESLALRFGMKGANTGGVA
ncbi:MAG: hypothetical protein K1X78_08195 [Verrucomicrobiaceae bacterium]|nr:hypothetical protein [Verrucomicrobiaceae bacterium]